MRLSPRISLSLSLCLWFEIFRSPFRAWTVRDAVEEERATRTVRGTVGHVLCQPVFFPGLFFLILNPCLTRAPSTRPRERSLSQATKQKSEKRKQERVERGKGAREAPVKKPPSSPVPVLLSLLPTLLASLCYGLLRAPFCRAP